MPFDPPRVPLALLPTPLHRLDRASEDLGLDLWIKRDDLTGFAMGGNKGRKLEYLIADAIQREADAVVACGSLQSNFVRQLGAACSRYGLECHAAVMDLPYDAAFGVPAGPRPGGGGNETLDAILGVRLHRVPDAPWEQLFEAAEQVAGALESQGRKVYRIPIGGSSPLGAFAFVRAAEELAGIPHFDAVVCPTSSGSTHAGLAYALHGGPTRVVGIACDPEPEVVDDLQRLVLALDAMVGGRREVAAEYLDVRQDFVGPGYGVPSREGDAALRYLARREGVFLDPVYSAKAFAGLIEMAKRRELRGRVLFWHTGGTPAIFAFPPPSARGENL